MQKKRKIGDKVGGSYKLKELTRSSRSTASLMNAIMNFLLKNEKATGVQVLKNIFEDYWNVHYSTTKNDEKEAVSFKNESATNFGPDNWSNTLGTDGHNSVTKANELQELLSQQIKPYGNGEDGYGSDSDYEGEEINGDKTYGRKFVVPTGMRAIVVSSCASAKKRDKYKEANWANMYYEAENVFKNNNRLKNISFLPEQIHGKDAKYKLILQDVNKCINMVKYENNNEDNNDEQTDIIYDVTSSTQNEMGEIVAKALWKNKKDYVNVSFGFLSLIASQ